MAPNILSPIRKKPAPHTSLHLRTVTLASLLTSSLDVTVVWKCKIWNKKAGLKQVSSLYLAHDLASLLLNLHRLYAPPIIFPTTLSHSGRSPQNPFFLILLCLNAEPLQSSLSKRFPSTPSSIKPSLFTLANS